MIAVLVRSGIRRQAAQRRGAPLRVGTAGRRENVKALAAYLGHSDPAFTLRVYTHLMPSSEHRARRAIDELFQHTAAGNGRSE